MDVELSDLKAGTFNGRLSRFDKAISSLQFIDWISDDIGEVAIVSPVRLQHTVAKIERKYLAGFLVNANKV
jgi:hypothetical protein